MDFSKRMPNYKDLWNMCTIDIVLVKKRLVADNRRTTSGQCKGRVKANGIRDGEGY